MTSVNSSKYAYNIFKMCGNKEVSMNPISSRKYTTKIKDVVGEEKKKMKRNVLIIVL